MKKTFLFLFIAGALASCVNNPEGEKATTGDAATAAATEGENLKVDLGQSSVLWTGSKVSGSHNGSIKIQSGDLFLKDSKLSGGSFLIDMNTIADSSVADTAYKAKLEGHLKSDDFFAVAKYPTSKFEITKVEDKGNNQLQVSGNLTLRDSTKNISFPVQVSENTAGKFAGKADFNINRKDWGVAYTGMKDDLIADEINFKINLVAGK